MATTLTARVSRHGLLSRKRGATQSAVARVSGCPADLLPVPGGGWRDAGTLWLRGAQCGPGRGGTKAHLGKVYFKSSKRPDIKRLHFSNSLSPLRKRYTQIHMCLCTCVCVYIYIQRHTHLYIYTHTYIYMPKIGMFMCLDVSKKLMM